MHRTKLLTLDHDMINTETKFLMGFLHAPFQKTEPIYLERILFFLALIPIHAQKQCNSKSKTLSPFPETSQPKAISFI